MIKVVNKYTYIPAPGVVTIDIDIHRGTPVGNPYTHVRHRMTLEAYMCQSREEAIEKYTAWLTVKLADKKSSQYRYFMYIVKMASQHDVNLICYCAPKPCHGDVIKRLVENLIL